VKQKIARIHPADNVLVALTDLPACEDVILKDKSYKVVEFIPAKHKFAIDNIPEGGEIIMYGVLVGRAQSNIQAGGLLSTANVKHAANGFSTGNNHMDWNKPDAGKWQNSTFNGFHRADGSVGTANYWLVIPMVFCENRNIEVLREAISANPAIGYTSDLLVTLGGSVILSEFPELCGVEQNLIDRCVDKTKAERFSSLVKSYSQRAEEAGSGFYMNPSPGNIKDGLITDAIKSAGAAKKGGTSPVTDVLDYPEKVTKPGLNLLCTPGNDVESTTAEVGSGANIVLFTTGLGTPTGNPIVPVIKIATNTTLYRRMADIIDINTGTIVEGDETIEQAGERILDYIIKVAGGEIEVSAVRHGQDDFIPWKRGVSL
jgi:altronate dehydratase